MSVSWIGWTGADSKRLAEDVAVWVDRDSSAAEVKAAGEALKNYPADRVAAALREAMLGE